MDNEYPEPERSAPRITVEIAHSMERGQAARRAGCPHRIKLRDMNPIARYFTIETAVLTAGAVPVAILCLAAGLIGLQEAMSGGASERLMADVLAILISVPLALGGIESLRAIRSLHSPNASLYYLHFVALVVLIAGLIGDVQGREWIMLAAVPALAVANDLRTSRVYLRGRSTCRTEPTLPPEVLKGMLKWSDEVPADASESRSEAGAERWVCPHTMDWKQVRPWVLAEWVVHRWIRFAYFGGTAVLLLAVMFNMSELLPVRLDNRSLELGLLVVAPLVFNLVAYSEWWHSGPEMHRQLTVTYVWSIAAYVMTAGLAGWAASALDRPYLWALVPLALASMYMTLWRVVLYSDPAECETDPEIHPRLRARLKTLN